MNILLCIIAIIMLYCIYNIYCDEKEYATNVNSNTAINNIVSTYNNGNVSTNKIILDNYLTIDALEGANMNHIRMTTTDKKKVSLSPDVLQTKELVIGDTKNIPEPNPSKRTDSITIKDGRIVTFIPNRNYPGCDYGFINSIDAEDCAKKCRETYPRTNYAVSSLDGKNCFCKWSGCMANDVPDYNSYVFL